MARLELVLEVLEAGDADLGLTLAELRERLGGEHGTLRDPRGGAPHEISLAGFSGASPELRLQITFVEIPEATAEERILTARLPARRVGALTFEQILEESRGRTGYEEIADLPNPPTLRRMRAELGRLVAEGRAERLGSGGRGDPYRYWCPAAPR